LLLFVVAATLAFDSNLRASAAAAKLLDLFSAANF
jgi:hypothetical protein